MNVELKNFTYHDLREIDVFGMDSTSTITNTRKCVFINLTGEVLGVSVNAFFTVCDWVWRTVKKISKYLNNIKVQSLYPINITKIEPNKIPQHENMYKEFTSLYGELRDHIVA